MCREGGGVVVRAAGLDRGTWGIVSRAYCGGTFRSSCFLAALNGDVVLCRSVLWVLNPLSPPRPLPILPQIRFAFPPRAWHRGGVWGSRLN